jgi:hypothetical protein
VPAKKVGERIGEAYCFIVLPSSFFWRGLFFSQLRRFGKFSNSTTFHLHFERCKKWHKLAQTGTKEGIKDNTKY